MASPSDAARALIESIKAELREVAGKAWVEPFRTHLDIRAKMRGDDLCATYTVTIFLEGATIMVTEGFGGDRRIRSVRR